VTEFIILVLVVGTALAFDFTNGFHDTGNAMATSIATGALKPKVAVALSGVLNLVGAFLSTQVAKTVAKVVHIQDKNGAPLPFFNAPGGPHLLLTIVFAGLVGGIIWNLVTWLLGLPSSSSHALFGGLIGAAVAGLGFTKGVDWTLVLSYIVIPAVLSPIVALIIAAAGTFCVYSITSRVGEKSREKGFRWGQIGSASLVSLAHGTGDAQKTMGVIFLALVAHGSLTADGDIPFWVKLSCAAAIALGTYIGGWRIIRTLGKGLVEISSPQGMAAESASAAVILTSSTSVSRCLPPTSPPARSWVPAWAARGPRSAGGLPDGWPQVGSSHCRWRRWSVRSAGTSRTCSRARSTGSSEFCSCSPSWSSSPRSSICVPRRLLSMRTT